MRKLIVDPNRIWSWYPGKNFDSNRLWENISPVPVFKIPNEHKETEHEYILIDGSHRRLRAIFMRVDLEIALYDFGESINLERDGLAEFAYYDDPKLYQKLLKAYKIRDDLPGFD